MAAITVTVADIQPENASMVVSGQFGATISAGKLVFRSPSDGKWYLADWDEELKPPAGATMGIALSGGVNNQWGSFVTLLPGRTVNMGGGLTKRAVYVAGDAGDINPIADIAASDYLYIVGYAESTSILRVLAVRTGVNDA